METGDSDVIRTSPIRIWPRPPPPFPSGIRIFKKIENYGRPLILPLGWPSYPLLMINNKFALYYLFVMFFFLSRSSISFSVDLSCVYCWSFFAVFLQ